MDDAAVSLPEAVWSVTTAALLALATGTIGKAFATFIAGCTSIASWLGLLAGKTDDEVTLGEIQETTAGATYDNTTDSQEALQENLGEAGAGLTGIPKTGYKLASDGLDSVSTLDPTPGDPSAWNFRHWLMWLVHRFRNASKTPTALTVKTANGTTLSTQVVSDDGAGTESTGEPT